MELSVRLGSTCGEGAADELKDVRRSSCSAPIRLNELKRRRVGEVERRWYVRLESGRVGEGGGEGVVHGVSDMGLVIGR